MNASDILSSLGLPLSSTSVDKLFSSFNTLNRPALPDDKEYVYHDWVLVRRKGVELGFADSEYQSTADRFRWGHGELLLTQAYFYSGFDDIQPFTGELPYGLTFADSREIARAKLAAFEATRHSYINDTWDVDGYRLSVTYKEGGAGIDRMVCDLLAAPIQRIQEVTYPKLASVTVAFGFSIHSQEFTELWGDLLDEEKAQEAIDDGEIDFTQSYGATLGFVDSSTGPDFRSIILHRNRDTESAGWAGELPQGLDFEDSPEILFQKIKDQPVQQSDSALTGHAVWHFDDYTLHVLYSNLDNRLLRVKLIAPGNWKCIEDS